MLHILLADFAVRRDGDQAVRWPLSPRQLAELRDQTVRVVYDDARALRPVLRALCVHDVSAIEVLDIDAPDWAFVFYDDRGLRSALRQLGLPVLAPVLMSQGRSAALWLIGQLTRSDEAAIA